jgi:hypothetical protein
MLGPYHTRPVWQKQNLLHPRNVMNRWRVKKQIPNSGKGQFGRRFPWLKIRGGDCAALLGKLVRDAVAGGPFFGSIAPFEKALHVL